MFQLVYISVAAYRFKSDGVIKEILSSSITNNARFGVTGVLLYYQGTFLQLLEGLKEDVESIYSRIKRDERHKDLEIVYTRAVNEHMFANWSMGFIDVQTLPNDADDFISFFNKIRKNSENQSQQEIEQTQNIIDKFTKGEFRNYIR